MKIGVLVAFAILAFVQGRFEAYAQATSAENSEAAPFGLRRDMTRTQLGTKVEQIAPGTYKLASVPRPHPDFESYVVQVGPTTGLCFVKAIGKNVTTGAYGTELKSHFTKIRDQVASTYGKYQEVDMLRTGSIWDEPRDWMMGLAKKERLLFTKWAVDTGATMRQGLRDVFLGAAALSSSTGYVVLEYYFDNEPQCQKEIDNASGTVF